MHRCRSRRLERLKHNTSSSKRHGQAIAVLNLPLARTCSTSGSNRTKRALIRQQFREKPDESTHIARFAGCSRNALFCAVCNYERDDLDQDWAYTEGVVGDVINVDRLIWNASPEPVDNEAIERAQVVRKLEEEELRLSFYDDDEVGTASMDEHSTSSSGKLNREMMHTWKLMVRTSH